MPEASRLMAWRWWTTPVIALLLIACGTVMAAEGGHWVAPVGWQDSEGLWVDIPLSYDGSTASYAADQSNRVGNGPWLELHFASAIRTDRVLVNADFGFGIVDVVDLEARAGDGSWTSLHHGPVANCADDIHAFPALTTDAIRFRFHYLSAGYYFWLYHIAVFELPPAIVAPAVATTPATSVTATSAALHGTVTSDGGEPCAVRFLYRPVGASVYTATAWAGSIVSGQGSSSVLLPVTGLQSGVAYEYHIEAQNQMGVAIGADIAFTPQPVPLGSVEWLSASDVQPDTLGSMTWDAAVQALDDDPTTAARCYHPLWATQWGPYVQLALPEVEIDHVRLSAGANPYIDAVQVEIEQSGGGWQTVYQGAFTDRAWQVYPLAARAIYPRARVRFHVATTGVGTNWELFEFQVRMPVLVSFATGTDLVVTQPGRIDLPLRFQPAISSVPLALRFALGGTAQVGVDWQLFDPADLTAALVVPAGVPAPTVSVDVLAVATGGSVLATYAVAEAMSARIVAPSATTISIQRGPPPPVPTFSERKSPLHRQPVERFDAARWAHDAGYRTAYVAARVPERVWDTLSHTESTRRLVVVGPTRYAGTVGGAVTMVVESAPNVPVSCCVDRPDIAGISGLAAWTVVTDPAGKAEMQLSIFSVGHARLIIGSPVAVGNGHVVIEGRKP